MAQNNGPRDEKLIAELYRKLNWFTFQASEEEFDAEQVKAILNLLDTLDPLPGEIKIPDKIPHPNGNAQPKEKAQANKDTQPNETAQSGDAVLSDIPQNSADERTQEKTGETTVSASDTAAAFQRFLTRYNISDENLAKKDGRAYTAGGDSNILPFPTESSENLSADAKDNADEKSSANDRRANDKHPTARKRFWSTASGRVAVALIVVVAGVCIFGVGTSAVKQKSFFEIVRDGVNSMKITVTGNEMESEPEVTLFEREDETLYNSWEELKNEYSDIMILEIEPDDFLMKEIKAVKNKDYVLIQSYYISELTHNGIKIIIQYFMDEYKEIGLDAGAGWEYIESDEESGANYYEWESNYKGIWTYGKAIYTVEGDNLEEVKEFIYNMIG